MKRIIGLALCLCMMCMAMSALAGVPEKPQTYAYAYDFDGTVLSEADKQQITAYGSALEEQTGMQVIAVVVEFLDGMMPEDYATDLINTWGIGQAGEDNGAVILLARGDRKIQIGTGKGIDRILTGAKCGELIDARLDAFADNRFAEGMVGLYADVCNYLAAAQGKTLAVGEGASSPVSNSYTSGTYVESGPGYVYGHVEFDDMGGFDLFGVIFGILFVYVIICIIFNALAPVRGGCLNYLFLGWLFGRMGSYRRPPRPRGFGPRPPHGFGPRPPRPPRPPRSGGFGGGFGGFGGGRGFGGGGGFHGGGFGGGGSRGGGGGRSF